MQPLAFLFFFFSFLFFGLSKPYYNSTSKTLYNDGLPRQLRLQRSSRHIISSSHHNLVVHNNVLCVSGFWALPSKYSDSPQESAKIYSEWFRTTLGIDCPYIFFYGTEFDRSLASPHRQTQTEWVHRPMEEFSTAAYPIKSYEKIWCEKAELLWIVSKMHPDVEWLAWVDAGINVYRDHSPPNVQWPQTNLSALYPHRIVYVQTRYRVSGTAYLVHRSVVEDFRNLVHKFLNACLSQSASVDGKKILWDQRLCGDDQYIYQKIIEVYPHLFHRHGIGNWARIVRDSYGEFSDATFANWLNDILIWLYFHLVGWFFVP